MPKHNPIPLAGTPRAVVTDPQWRCVQCNRPWPVADFRGPSGKLGKRCGVCRERYRNWGSLSLTERLQRSATNTLWNRADLSHSLRAYLILQSGNIKTGPIPVSVTDSRTCPPNCAFLGQGCYAAYGPLGGHWKALDRAERGLPWDAFCAAVAGLPAGQLWRHNEAGDLPGDGPQIDPHALWLLVRANRGRRGFTFTHKPCLPSIARQTFASPAHRSLEPGVISSFAKNGPKRRKGLNSPPITRSRGGPLDASAKNGRKHVESLGSGPIDRSLPATNQHLIAGANAAGFCINLSADSLEQADELAELAIGPVVTVVASDAPVRLRTPAGRRVIVCPAQTVGLTCAECELCAIPSRKGIIGFRAHGQFKANVDRLVQLRRR